MTGLASVVLTPRTGVLRRIVRRPSGSGVMVAIAGLWFLIVAVAAVAPGLIARGDPEVLQPTRVLRPPGPGAVLGTDQYGRSVYLLLVHGSGTAITIGVAATAVAVVAGCLIGMLAGYAGGVVDAVIGRLLDIMLALPGVLLAIVITAAAGASLGTLIVSVATAFVAGFARIMRGQVLSTRGRLYVRAAHSVGLSPVRVVLRHVLPNAFAPVAVLATIAVGDAILVASALSFLGLGPNLLVPDWGQLLAAGQAFLRQSWWVSTFSGVAISLTVISVGIVGDWIRDRVEG